MVTVGSVVGIILALLIGAAVLGLLWWLIGYIEKQGFGPPIVFKVVRVVYVVLVVLLLIGFLLHLLGVPVIAIA